MKPTNEGVLVSRPVSKAVGNMKNNGPELLQALASEGFFRHAERGGPAASKAKPHSPWVATSGGI